MAQQKTAEEYRVKKPGSLWGKPGEIWCTVKVFDGVLPSGAPYRGESVIPDRTPEEQAAWERNVRAACREFVRDYIRHNGHEAARARFADDDE